MSEVVRYQSRDGVAVITIDRPDRLNALDEAVIQGLAAAWQRLEDGADRVAVRHAAGDRAFSVGADVKSPPKEMWQGVPSVGVPVSKPVIAADAERAREAGMVNRVVPAGSELEAALEWAGILRDSAPLVVSTLKRFALETLNRSPAEAAAIARERLLTVRDSDDGAEGRRAFAEKRTPAFRGS